MIGSELLNRAEFRAAWSEFAAFNFRFAKFKSFKILLFIILNFWILCTINVICVQPRQLLKVRFRACFLGAFCRIGRKLPDNFFPGDSSGLFLTASPFSASGFSPLLVVSISFNYVGMLTQLSTSDGKNIQLMQTQQISTIKPSNTL